MNEFVIFERDQAGNDRLANHAVYYAADDAEDDAKWMASRHPEKQFAVRPVVDEIGKER